MSKFDFAKLREQVKQTNESLKELYKGTDNHIHAAQERINDPVWRKKQKENNTISKALEGYLKDRKNNPEKYKKILKEQVKKRSQNESWKQKVGRYERTSEQLEKQSKFFSKRIFTPFGIFDSRLDAANFIGIDPATLGQRMEKFSDEYYFLDDQGNKLEIQRNKRNKEIKKNEVSCVTPLGSFINIREAAKAHNWSSHKIKSQMGANPHLFYKSSEGPGTDPNKIITPFGNFRNVRAAHTEAVRLNLHKDIASPNYWFMQESKLNPKQFYKKK